MHCIECKGCKQIFFTKRANQQFCTNNCRLKHQHPKKPKTGIYKECDVCGQKFYVQLYRKDTAKYCGNQCWQNAHAAKPKVCSYCGKEHSKRKAMFCSHACQLHGSARSVQKITRSCAQCGSLMTVKETDKRLYCGKNCVNESRKNRLHILCQRCGKKFTVPKHRKTAKFCSINCMLDEPKPIIRKPKGYWRNWNNLERELKAIIIKDIFPTNFTIQKTMGSSALAGIGFFGGIGKVALKLGCRHTPRFYISLDGHFLRSGYELIVDEYLYSRGIYHEVGEKLPGSNFRYDFKIQDYYIEIWGFKHREHKVSKIVQRYQKKRLIKEEYYRSSNLKLISIEEDFFNKPVNKIIENLDSMLIKLGFDVTKKINVDFYKSIEVASMWSESQTRDWLQSYIQKNGIFPLRSHLERTGQGDKIYIIKRYGGFNYFRRLFGYSKRQSIWNTNRIVQEFINWYEILGHFPQQRELPNNLRHAADKFGGLRAIRQLVETKIGPCAAKNDISDRRTKLISNT